MGAPGADRERGICLGNNKTVQEGRGEQDCRVREATLIEKRTLRIGKGYPGSTKKLMYPLGLPFGCLGCLTFHVITPYDGNLVVEIGKSILTQLSLGSDVLLIVLPRANSVAPQNYNVVIYKNQDTISSHIFSFTGLSVLSETICVLIKMLCLQSDNILKVSC